MDAADQLQSDDNVTAVVSCYKSEKRNSLLKCLFIKKKVVRLKHWGKRMHDYTKELRAYRMENSTMSSRQSW